MEVLISSLELIARAGGGGSGGSSGGSGGGGGAAGLLLVIIFYYPTYRLSDYLRQRLEFWPALILSSLASFLYSAAVLICLYLFGAGYFVALYPVVLIVLGSVVGLRGVRPKFMKRIRVAEARRHAALQNDLSWQDETLISQIASIFYRFQDDWSAMDTINMKQYLHPGYWYHIELIMRALKLRGRVNIVSNVQIRSIDFITIRDVAGSERDMFEVLIVARADDRLIDYHSNKLLHRDSGEFAEVWQFARINGQWLLTGIEQVTRDKKRINDSIKAFSIKNDYHYSADWGSLLLPARGQLFRNSSFRKSDINNHVIGEYKGILFEIYTYIRNAGELSIFSREEIFVLQATLPKTYGKIVVQQKQPAWHIDKLYPIPRHLHKISMEGVTFDRKYQVFAESKEQVTSFELLDPSLMEQLIQAETPINMEVYDNVLYLYSGTKVSYEEIFAIFKKAYDNVKQ